ncbi:hypothetical protein AC579_2649 [Pseudocercospora musae]|uniref:Uncharacterized protein n=1 Tax=Pseudocercospora musae TaxID=113226 RepID=A0A139IGN0_9PEZI|nr:hypothetical protein AC579_2649 [Pseudocercospora musae]
MLQRGNYLGSAMNETNQGVPNFVLKQWPINPLPSLQQYDTQAYACSNPKTKLDELPALAIKVQKS